MSTVKVTRARTALLWQSVAKDPQVPTSLLQLLTTLIQRQDDVEEELGYTDETTLSSINEKVDTQGR